MQKVKGCTTVIPGGSGGTEFEMVKQFLQDSVNVVPHSVIALGFSKQTECIEKRDHYDESCVHWVKW